MFWFIQLRQFQFHHYAILFITIATLFLLNKKTHKPPKQQQTQQNDTEQQHQQISHKQQTEKTNKKNTARHVFAINQMVANPRQELFKQQRVLKKQTNPLRRIGQSTTQNTTQTPVCLKFSFRR